MSKLAIITVVIILLFGCENSNQTSNAKDLLNDSILVSGWYLISDTTTGFKRKFDKTNEIFNIEPRPILTSKSFKTVSIFQEKSFYCFYIMLDDEGAKSLNHAISINRAKNLALIIDNKFIYKHPYSAKVSDNEDPRVYGKIVPFPCNFYSEDEMNFFKTKLETEKIELRQD
ncbi:MAG TPA: hypothetical protein VEC36_12895 [Patescibacteria group bacterium]|nr:hypothetical protein [Patescibacteria group bacterium]